MQRLMDAVLAIAQELSPARAESIAKAIEGAAVPADTAGLASSMPSNASRALVEDLKIAWAGQSISGAELAGMLRGAIAAWGKARSAQEIELVWTGPDTQLVPVRRSEQVLKQLIDAAEREAFIVSYVSFNLPSIDQAISEAIGRGVRVRMLLESEGRDGSFGRTIDRYKRDFPGLELYVWPVENREAVGQGTASVHAKCAVADGKQLFVTSANLTGAAMDKNMEMGLLISGGGLPKLAASQLGALVDTDEIILR